MIPGPPPSRTESLAGRLRAGDPGIAIRPIEAADQAFCRTLFHRDRAPHFAPLRLGEPMLIALLDQQFHAQQAGYGQCFPDAESFIIEYAGATVGRLIIRLIEDAAALPDGSAQSGCRTLHLVDIVLLPDARGRGIGSAVIETIADAASAADSTRIALTVLQTNHSARRLYERLGFIAAETGPHIAMVKPLLRKQ